MGKLLKWFDQYIVTILAGFLIVFIPLYPKIPLFDVIPGYIVRVRIEDILILFTIGVLVIQVVRRKINLKGNPLTLPILLYLAAGFLSMLSAVFITKTVPVESLHIGKMVLHYLRRIEYFSLFFIAFAAIKKPRDAKVFLSLITVVILAVAVYGYGQKYLYWPAFSTMNREFSKGWLLYLTENSRVLSTFGGHYDLAAYLMLMLTLLWGIFFGLKNIIAKILIFVVAGAAFWTLILTASRTSFIAYLGSVSLVILLWIFRRSILWVITRWIAVLTLSIFVMISFGDLSERFATILRIEERFGGLKSVLLKPARNPPQDKALFLINNLEAVTSKSDQPPTPNKQQAQKPVDVTEDILEPFSDPSDSSKILYKKRTFSDSSLRYDLSTGIRLDALWPRAIAGFMKNPLLGSGYSTLNKTQLSEFTEAESTDNDFLRMLGETGLLGTLTFLGILTVAVIYIWKALPGVNDRLTYGLLVSAIAGTFGMLVNAIYIDVFEASKVAYTYWSFLGVAVGAIAVQKSEIERHKKPLKIPFSWKNILVQAASLLKSDKFLLTLILLLAFFLRTYKIDTPLADWHSWRQSDTAAVTRNFSQWGINLLYPTYYDLSSIPSGQPNPKGLRMVEFPIYNAVSVIVKRIIPEGPFERAMRLTSIFASLGSLIFLFQLTKKYLDRKTAYVSAFIFATLPYNIFYSRVILPEPSVIFFALGTLYFFSVFLDMESKSLVHKLKYFLLTAVFGAFALLVKPFAVFILLPMPFILFAKSKLKSLKRIEIYLLSILIITPFILWRLWISQFPEGIPAYEWLFNGDNIRFKGAFFQWLFAERIGKLILGYWGLFPFLLGVLIKQQKHEENFFRWMLVGALLYLTIVATGNIRHDYYQTLIIPVLVVFTAKGFIFLITKGEQFSRKISLVVALVCLLFMHAFGWYLIRDFYNINHPEIVEAGNKVAQVSNRHALVIAPYMGDTAFLYQTQRSGWPIIEGSVEELIKRGADYYVSVNFDDVTNKIIKTASDPYNKQGYKIIAYTNEYIVVQLVSDSLLPKD